MGIVDKFSSIIDSCSLKPIKYKETPMSDIKSGKGLRSIGFLEVCLLEKNKPKGYKVVLIRWVDCENKIYIKRVLAKRKEILRYLEDNKDVTVLLNGSIHKDKSIYIHKPKNKLEVVNYIANRLRSVFEKAYGINTDLCGYCIQASEMLQAIYKVYNIQSKTVEGWCEFDDEYYGSDRPYDPHTWLEILLKGQMKPLYVDITADQFNPGMYKENEFSGVIINLGLPHGMTYDEPEGWDE